MRSVARRVFRALVAILTRRKGVDGKAGRSGTRPTRRPRLSPGALEAQTALVRRQLVGDAIRPALSRHPPTQRRIFERRADPQAGPRAGYRWGQSPGDKAEDPSPRTPTPDTLPDRPPPALDDDRSRREDEREVRRFRQIRRTVEAEASGAATPAPSRLSPEAVESQAALVRQQLQRDAEARAHERRRRTPLRNRTRIGPLREGLRPRPNLPQRDRRVDYLVTAGFIVAAVIVGGLTRLDVYDYSGLPWMLAAGLAAVLVGLLIFDYRRWHGSFPVRFTRLGTVTALIFLSASHR